MPGGTDQSDSGVDCAIQVSTGCGLVFGTSSELAIDLWGFDGPGLSAWQDPATQCWGLQIDCQWIADNCALGIVPGCGLFENLVGEVEVVPADLAGRGLIPGGIACELNVALGCGFQFDLSDQIEVDAAALAGDGLVPGTGCQLDVQTKGFTGDKQVVTAIECDPYDPYACPVAVIETWHFENGLLKSVT